MIGARPREQPTSTRRNAEKLSVTFSLVPGSNAESRLVPVRASRGKKHRSLFSKEIQDLITALNTSTLDPKPAPPSHLDQDCYFPQDGYDYGQHLLPCTGTANFSAQPPGAVLPQSETVADELENDSQLEEADDDFFEQLIGLQDEKVVQNTLWGAPANDEPDAASFAPDEYCAYCPSREGASLGEKEDFKAILEEFDESLDDLSDDGKINCQQMDLDFLSSITNAAQPSSANSPQPLDDAVKHVIRQLHLAQQNESTDSGEYSEDETEHQIFKLPVQQELLSRVDPTPQIILAPRGAGAKLRVPKKPAQQVTKYPNSVDAESGKQLLELIVMVCYEYWPTVRLNLCESGASLGSSANNVKTPLTA